MHGVPASFQGPDPRPGTSRFIVEGDGMPLYASPVLKEGDPAQEIEVDVTGVQLLTLGTTDGGDTNYDDLGTWGDARVER
jgi:hypothetical protein